MKETWEFAHKHLGKLRFRCGQATIIPLMIPMFLIMGKDTDIIIITGISVIVIQGALLSGIILHTK